MFHDFEIRVYHENVGNLDKEINSVAESLCASTESEEISTISRVKNVLSLKTYIDTRCTHIEIHNVKR